MGISFLGLGGMARRVRERLLSRWVEGSGSLILVLDVVSLDFMGLSLEVFEDIQNNNDINCNIIIYNIL